MAVTRSQTGAPSKKKEAAKPTPATEPRKRGRPATNAKPAAAKAKPAVDKVLKPAVSKVVKAAKKAPPKIKATAAKATSKAKKTDVKKPATPKAQSHPAPSAKSPKSPKSPKKSTQAAPVAPMQAEHFYSPLDIYSESEFKPAKPTPKKFAYVESASPTPPAKKSSFSPAKPTFTPPHPAYAPSASSPKKASGGSPKSMGYYTPPYMPSDASPEKARFAWRKFAPTSPACAPTSSSPKKASGVRPRYAPTLPDYVPSPASSSNPLEKKWNRAKNRPGYRAAMAARTARIRSQRKAGSVGPAKNAWRSPETSPTSASSNEYLFDEEKYNQQVSPSKHPKSPSGRPW